MTTDNMSASASALQAARVAESMANHKERIEWLSSQNPTWCDGTPVNPSDRSMLLRQSRAVLSGEEPA